MNQTNKNKKQKTASAANPLESLKEIGTATAQKMRQEASQIPQEFMRQLLGVPPRPVSGEIAPGETVEFTQMLPGQEQRLAYERKRIAYERKLLKEEEQRVAKKSNELKIRLNILQQEIVTLAEKTEGLAQETQIAAMQVAVEPGVYHIIFFEKLFEFIKSFRRKIEEASVWLQTTNKRASKKNRWGANYKKYGAKYLLSGEHYLSRSAG